jgi:hypothetical protein
MQEFTLEPWHLVVLFLPYDTAVERCLRILQEHFPEVDIADPA